MDVFNWLPSLIHIRCCLKMTTDYFTLVKINDSWKIMNKVFSHEGGLGVDRILLVNSALPPSRAARKPFAKMYLRKNN
jgi:hypothetical protein